MKHIEIFNTHLPVFCAGIDGKCERTAEIWAECEMAQGEAGCGNCDVGFYLVFPRDLVGDRQFSYGGISGDLPIKCPKCGTKGFVILNAENEEPEPDGRE